MAHIPQSRSEEVAQKWTQCLPPIAAYVRSITHNFHDAQDILQEISIVVVRKYGEYDASRPFIAWVIGIARNEVLAHRRRMSLQASLFDDATLEHISQAFADSGDKLNVLAEALEACVKRVPEKSRRLLQLRYVDDLRYEQMAEALDASVTSIKVAMHRLRAGLRACIERHPAARGAS